MAGLTQRSVARAIGSSQAEISRRERGHVAGIGLAGLLRHGAAVGMRVSVRLWPVGGSIRDAAQARHVAAFVARVGRAWRVTLEAPIPIDGDLRAIDVLLRSPAGTVAVEVITRLSDLQAQVRAARLKARDVSADRLVLIIADTHVNRRAVADARPAIAAEFDLDARRVIADLVDGRLPPRDALIIATPRSASVAAR